MFNQTGWAVQAHNRMWAADTTYATQNGGKWKFDIDKGSGYALPRECALADLSWQAPD